MIAANPLSRLYEAEHLSKPALFLCDRDELREQAWESSPRRFTRAQRVATCTLTATAALIETNPK